DGLGDELHVDEAPAAELDVKPSRRFLPELRLHAAAKLAHLLEVGRRRIRPVDDVVDLPSHGAAETPVAAHKVRPGERLALPRAGPLAVVLAERRDAGGEATPLGARTESQVDRHDDAGRRDVAQYRGERLHGPIVEHMSLDPLGA